MRRAEASGEGDWIDIALHECQAGCRDRQSTNLTIAAYTGLAVGRLGAAVFRMGAGVRPCNDGYVNVMGGWNRLPRLLRLIGREDLMDHPQLMNPPGTVPDDLTKAVESAYAAWLGPRNKRDIVAEAQAAGMMAGPVCFTGTVLPLNKRARISHANRPNLFLRSRKPDIDSSSP